MRIAYAITRADAVGGASVHVRDLACAMRARGNQVLVFIGGTGPVTDELAGADVPFRPLAHLHRSFSPWSDTRAVWEVAAALREFQPHLVSAHTAKAGWIARAACARPGIPAIYTPHGLWVGSRAKAPLRRLARLVERAAGRWNYDVVCVCEAERQLAPQRRARRGARGPGPGACGRRTPARASPARCPARSAILRPRMPIHNSAISSRTMGRGPTRLISPRSTFQSCGSSSRLVLRKNPPTRALFGEQGRSPRSFLVDRPAASGEIQRRFVPYRETPVRHRGWDHHGLEPENLRNPLKTKRLDSHAGLGAFCDSNYPEP